MPLKRNRCGVEEQFTVIIKTFTLIRIINVALYAFRASK